MTVQNFEKGEILIPAGTPYAAQAWVLLKGKALRGTKIVAEKF
jgi:hypothetical protein